MSKIFAGNKLFLLFFVLLFLTPQSQEKPAVEKSPKIVLVEIQDAFSEGDVSKLSQYLSNKTYLSISENLSGYFSYSQCYNLLSDYMNVHKPLNFHFASIVDETKSPFAWGDYRFMKNGVRGLHKVFVSLSRSESGYFISQITIN